MKTVIAVLTRAARGIFESAGIIFMPVVVVVMVGFAYGCTSNGSKSKGAKIQGAPTPDVSMNVINLVDPPDSKRPGTTMTIPNQMTMPATYRLQVVDGRQVLIRETDPRKILTSPTIAVIAGDVSTGDVGIQPALLSPEVATEIVKNRVQTDKILQLLPEFAAQMTAMAEQTKQLQQHNVTLTQQLANVARYAQQLEQKAKPNEPTDPGVLNAPAANP